MNDLDALPVRIARMIDVDDTSGCWRWTGTLNHGYPFAWWRDGERTHAYAHRITFHLLADPTLPISGGGKGDQIDHVAALCAHRPACVNPAHMERVTARTNSARSKMRPGKSSRYIGVSRYQGAWRAQIQVDGKRRTVGRFASEVDAARAYDAACIAAGEVPQNAAHGFLGVAA